MACLQRIGVGLLNIVGYSYFRRRRIFLIICVPGMPFKRVQTSYIIFLKNTLSLSCDLYWPLNSVSLHDYLVRPQNKGFVTLFLLVK